MYASEDNTYCLPGSDVLRNRLGITDPGELQEFETQAALIRAEQPLPSGRFGVRHYCAVHRHLFQDVYAWAGKFRTVRIGKSGVWFCYPEHIASELGGHFDKLKSSNYLHGLSAAKFVGQGASFLANINAVHPFREGNGRTQTIFFSMLAARAGHPLDLRRLPPQPMLAAMIASFQGDEAPLRAVLAEILL